jgi:hypothetical protein
VNTYADLVDYTLNVSALYVAHFVVQRFEQAIALLAGGDR